MALSSLVMGTKSMDLDDAHTHYSLPSVFAMRYTRKQEAEAAASPKSLTLILKCAYEWLYF